MKPGPRGRYIDRSTDFGTNPNEHNSPKRGHKASADGSGDGVREETADEEKPPDQKYDKHYKKSEQYKTERQKQRTFVTAQERIV
jgi:hypothetical protein